MVEHLSNRKTAVQIRPSRSIFRVEDTLARREIAMFINLFHSYISWADRPSRKLYWALRENGALVGAFGLGSCFHRPKAVANFMREHNLGFNEVGNNIVFCLQGAEKNAGSAFLALCRRDAVAWWKTRYGDDLRAFQSFVLPPRTGAVYKADNWRLVGETSGNPQKVRTLRSNDPIPKGAHVERRVFASGEVRLLMREQATQETPKLIFMRLA